MYMVSIGVQKVDGVWCVAINGPSGLTHFVCGQGTYDEANEGAEKVAREVDRKFPGIFLR